MFASLILVENNGVCPSNMVLFVLYSSIVIPLYVKNQSIKQSIIPFLSS
jgi:hypothetical protein